MGRRRVEEWRAFCVVREGNLRPVALLNRSTRSSCVRVMQSVAQANRSERGRETRNDDDQAVLAQRARAGQRQSQVSGVIPMKSEEEINSLRSKMIEHLEAALALADETADGTPGYFIESALDAVRAEIFAGTLGSLPPRRR
jgi:hypothetical protein